MDEALAHLRRHDPVLAHLIDSYPVPIIEKHTAYYQELVESIIGQQLSVKAASTIRNRVVALFGETFPSAVEILECDPERLRAAGLSHQKISYIQDLASKVIDGTVQFEHLDVLSNDEIITELTKVKGIGTWTVHMFLMFCMARLDVLPSGDLGIRNGITKLYGFAETATPTQVESIAIENNWQAFSTVASCYIWKSLENKPVR